MSISNPLSRRRVLGSISALGLSPFLPSLFGTRAADAAAAAVPKRLFIISTNHGTHYQNWKLRKGAPSADDFIKTDFTLPLAAMAEADFSPILRPLWKHRAKMTIVDGTLMRSAYSDAKDTNGHQAGTCHALTGALMKVPDVNSTEGPSIDQSIAAKISAPNQPITSANMQVWGGNGPYGGVSRTLDGAKVTAQQYGYWYDRFFGTAKPPTTGGGTDPVVTVDKFAAGKADALNLVNGQYKTLAGKLSALDKKKLEQQQGLFEQIRTKLGSSPLPPGTGSALNVPLLPGACMPPTRVTAEDSAKHQWEVSSAIAAAALHCDMTRVIAFEFSGADPKDVGIVGVNDFHQEVAHKADEGYALVTGGANTATTVPVATANAIAWHQYTAELISGLITLLDSVTESDGTTLLDNTLVLWTGELGTGNHDYGIMPFTMFGGSRIGIKTGNMFYFGQQYALPKKWGGPPTLGPPHNKFLTTIKRAYGLEDTSTGMTSVPTVATALDATGTLPGII